MKQIAFTNTEGQIMYIISPGSDNDYINGNTYGDYIARDIPADMDPTTFMTEYSWESDSWAHRGVRPSEYHSWLNGSWQLNTDLLFQHIRLERNIRLSATDWAMLPDAPVSSEAKAQIETYRQALRDVPDNNQDVTSMEEVVWPVLQ